MIDLEKKHLEFIQETLERIVPGVEVWAFGSRVKGSAKAHSDLDLVLIDKQKISLLKLSELKEIFEESNLPFQIDIVDWFRISEGFRKIILEQKVPLK